MKPGAARAAAAGQAVFLWAALLAAMSGCHGTASGRGPADQGPFSALAQMAARYRELTPQDLYKWLHQAHFGPGHLIADQEGACRDLLEETANLPPPPASFEEPLWEPLDDQGDLGRVNLRPYVRQGGDLEILCAALVKTAGDPLPGALAFEKTLSGLSRRWPPALPFKYEDLATFARQQRTLEYPPVHHSAALLKRYRPAYRVINKRYLPAAWREKLL